MSSTPARRTQPRPPETAKVAKQVQAAYRIFETSVDGKAVLDDLCDAFYDRISHVPGDPHTSAFNEGQRSVVAAIFQILEDLKTEKSQK